MRSDRTSRSRDVFICFSKARPGEARVALAIKDELERLGLSAFEYEDWSWVATRASDETEVDRRTLLALLDAATVIVLITPHEGEPSAGTQVELDELRGSARAIIAVTWSPRGWSEILEPERFAGLNLIWKQQGTSTRDNDVEDRQCEYVGAKVAEAAWLAHHLRLLYRDHPTTAGALLGSIPEGPYPPLQNLRIARPPVERTSWNDWWPDEERLAVLAREACKEASAADLQAFQLAWRDGRGVAAEGLATRGSGPLARTFRLFYAAGSALLALAVARGGQHDTVEAQHGRGLMLARFGRDEEALDTLRSALPFADPAQSARLQQAIALVVGDDTAKALDATNAALERASEHEMRCLLMYQRGLLHLRAGSLASAIEDFTGAESATATHIVQSAVLARALAHHKNADPAAALRDFGRVIARADETPRLAVSALQARGRMHADDGRSDEAFADWQAALDLADATEEQRFRTLEDRAALFETLGEFERAAIDYETMATYRNAAHECREQLQTTAANLRARAVRG